ncbi:hypothetical protein KI387_010543, partial [Taxus chinensis]
MKVDECWLTKYLLLYEFDGWIVMTVDQMGGNWCGDGASQHAPVNASSSMIASDAGCGCSDA